MRNKTKTEKSKSASQKAGYSLIFGGISVMLPFILICCVALIDPIFRDLVYIIGVALDFICVVLGLIFGVIGLESTRRELAKSGILLCVICLLLWLPWSCIFALG